MTRRSAIVVLFNPLGQVLLLRRSGTDPWRPHFWNCPGGLVQAGESFYDAAVRELYEEAGLSGIELKPAFPLSPISVVFSGLYSQPGQSVTLTDREHDAFGWFELGCLPEPLLVSTRILLERVALVQSSSSGR